MHRAPEQRAKDRRRLGLRVGLGVAVGLVYIGIDAVLDARIDTASGELIRVVELFHRLIDWVLPVLAGGLFGVFVHYLAQRAERAEVERRRAEDLHIRLHKVERDQAVWVIAASLLHDLKNPLHTLGLLLDELDAPEDEAERVRTLTRCRAQLDRLVAHVDSLKSLPVTDRPELPAVALDELVKGFVDEIVDADPGSRIRFQVHVERGVRALAAPSYLRIVLETLIENSLDVLRERGGAGEVRVDVTRSGDRALIRVSDDGPGIPEGAADGIFEPLRTTKARGLGLGLAIARALSRAMKGDLALEQRGDALTTFRVELAAA